MKRTIRMLVCMILAAVMLTISMLSFAEEDPYKQKYHMGKAVKTDKNYYDTKDIDVNDPHYGWDLGDFFITGYTQKTEDKDGNPVFLKNVGDEIALWFNLEQNIECLNGNEKLSISLDKTGCDEYFNTEETNLGHGTLIVRYTDYQNYVHDPVVYTDYLPALAEGADTKVELFEEGDYEVALDYEIKDKSYIIPIYTHYKIFFRFSVRNGNCMVFPFDNVTGAELTNTAIAENGFYLDLANSRYLTINIKKEILTEGADGLTEDTRFNRPAKDHDPFTAEGIYTITVMNQYTNQQTVKVIYVGTNNILKAYVTTGLPISEINQQLAAGAHINADGTITYPVVTEAPVNTDNNVQSEAPTESPSENTTDEPETSDSKSHSSTALIIILCVVGAALIALLVLYIIKSKNKKTENKEDEKNQENEGSQEDQVSQENQEENNKIPEKTVDTDKEGETK